MTKKLKVAKGPQKYKVQSRLCGYLCTIFGETENSDTKINRDPGLLASRTA